MTGRKWELVAASDQPEKYVICNGDEGDPGAFMDRILLESYPLKFAKRYDYSRICRRCEGRNILSGAEYPQAVIRTRKAIELCRERNWVGDHIFGSDFSFEISIFEERALLSVERKPL